MTKHMDLTMGGTCANNFMIGSMVNDLFLNEFNTSTTEGKNEEYYALDMKNIEIGEQYPFSPTDNSTLNDYKEK